MPRAPSAVLSLFPSFRVFLSYVLFPSSVFLTFPTSMFSTIVYLSLPLTFFSVRLSLAVCLPLSLCASLYVSLSLAICLPLSLYLSLSLSFTPSPSSSLSLPRFLPPFYFLFVTFGMDSWRKLRSNGPRLVLPSLVAEIREAGTVFIVCSVPFFDMGKLKYKKVGILKNEGKSRFRKKNSAGFLEYQIRVISFLV